MKSTTTTPVSELATRKRWARSMSKCMKHSRAEKDVLAHLAFRAGSGKVWGYTLKQLAADIQPEVDEKTVRRAVAKFQAQGIMTVKNQSQRPLEYTPVWTLCPSRLDILATDTSGKKETRTIPSPPPETETGIDSVFSAPLGPKGRPLRKPPETLTDTDFQVSTPSTNGKSTLPLSESYKNGLCHWCGNQLYRGEYSEWWHGGERGIACKQCARDFLIEMQRGD